jgi:hypothetical protein
MATHLDAQGERRRDRAGGQRGGDHEESERCWQQQPAVHEIAADPDEVIAPTIAVLTEPGGRPEGAAHMNSWFSDSQWRGASPICSAVGDEPHVLRAGLRYEPEHAAGHGVADVGESPARSSFDRAGGVSAAVSVGHEDIDQRPRSPHLKIGIRASSMQM